MITVKTIIDTLQQCKKDGVITDDTIVCIHTTMGLPAIHFTGLGVGHGYNVEKQKVEPVVGLIMD